MNVLEYRVTSDNGRSFVLLVDGTPLAQIIGAPDDAVPYWIVEYGIPGWPPSNATPAPLHGSDVRIVTVCSCGEYGCGHVRCRVTYSADRVIFDQFEGDFSANPSSLLFTFDRVNYERVMDELSQSAAEQREENKRRR